jgi:prepilin-type N-terminal cleavage/methylation domain-containing protein
MKHHARRFSRSASSRLVRRSERGFTLLEVMIALMIGMIGLLGTVAMQQTVLRASQNASEAATAMRLATQRLEQFSIAAVSATNPPTDELRARALITGAVGVWSTPEFLDSSGRCPTGTGAWTAACRWQCEWQVTDTGVGLPYNVSVRVTYNLDGDNPKIVRVDMERRKTF